ncbi:putative molybdenum cofactor guanylyltransferase [Fundidesulfovibrio magnetotacticus]|uniref:Probable molybdenum cofactor guanylyltransferase n=1 Tax=Fundidesulfovibrio magnetotacticus TaxID=2730080 RepID=A0A6V8LT68_9BACT|nr:molybdenum cofactor guanylyltransferase [Fundidesulfovibrio magnetotacticus]GFK95662.1 putative molybdenum cofactor guanylyltransferase [Fundidesulfovibrio magnetotacticus]
MSVPTSGPDAAPPAAVILAGGQSRRLGRDKAAVLMEGRTLLERAVALAGNFCAEVAVSGRDPGPLPGVSCWFLDERPGNGPMGGILTALERFRAPCLVLSCDLPFLDRSTLGTLLAAWRTRPPHALMTTFAQIETDYIEALVSVYEPGAADVMRRALDQGQRKLSRAFPPALRHDVPYTVANARPFFNVNTPEELRQVPGTGSL